MRSAIALLSGGLDSVLAAQMVSEQGIAVTALTCTTPFTAPDGAARRSAEQIGLPLRVVRLEEDYYAMLRAPRFGYGKNLNPCIDCKILMLRAAHKMMQETGASFVVTGEVVGQRPKSQFRHALLAIDQESGLEGLVLRPLSALLLPETTPEREGWVRRETLLAISGRKRTAQFDLARRMGITEFSAPAGGCLLTDRNYCARLKDVLAAGNLSTAETEILKYGRYFRFSPAYRLIVGRNEQENERIEALAQDNDILFMPMEVAGPTAVGRGDPTSEDLALSARIVARYCSVAEGEVYLVQRRTPAGVPTLIRASRAHPSEYEHLRV